MRISFVSASAVLYVLATAVVALAQDRPRTTRELVELALERNRDLLAARQRVAEAQALLRQAGVRLAPTVELELGSGRPVRTPGDQEYSASYFHPIELGGKRGKRRAVGRGGLALAEAELAERTRELSYQVKVRVAEAHAARRKHEALAQLLGTSRDSLRLTQARVEEGDAAVLEQRLLATEVARVQAQQATFRGRAASALLDVRRVVGLGPDEGVTLAPVSESEGSSAFTLSELRERALSNRPDLLAARAAEGQALAEVELARAEGVPDLTASATYTRERSDFDGLFGVNSSGARAPIIDRDNKLTVGLSIPLFAPGRNRGNVEAAVARSTAARMRREYLESSISAEVESALQRWSSARETLALFQRGIVDESTRSVAIMREAYTLGQLRLIDVLNEQRRLIDTQLAYIDAQTESTQAAAELERAVGTDLP